MRILSPLPAFSELSQFFFPLLVRALLGGVPLCLASTPFVAQTLPILDRTSSESAAAIDTPNPRVAKNDIPLGQSVTLSSMKLNGSAHLDGSSLLLTENTDYFAAASAFYPEALNINAFTTEFTFQLNNPGGSLTSMADGITFTIQNVGPDALGEYGGSLGYAPIGKSFAVKFDLHDNAMEGEPGEGPNSTGIYLDGASPTVPFEDITNLGIDLHSGHPIHAQMSYNGVVLTMVLIDTVTGVSWPHSYTVNIPEFVGGNTAYVGFTGGTGAETADQKILSWKYAAQTPTANGPAGNIYVVDGDNVRIQTFNASGVYQSQFGFGPSFDDPTGIVLSGDSVYVKSGDYACQIQKFDKQGNYLAQFGACATAATGDGRGLLDNAGNLATDVAGNIWVTSPDFYYMQKFDSNGKFLAIVCLGQNASGDVPNCPSATPFDAQPFAIVLDASGNIYVTNLDFFANNAIVKLDNNGKYLFSFGTAGTGNGQFSYPAGIAVDSDGSIYISDGYNNNVQVFDKNGVYQSKFGGKGSGAGQLNDPGALAFDSEGNLYVSDVGNDRVQKFTESGVYLGQFGSYGHGNGQFFAPGQIAIAN
jgi:sugar lactone lactonase YvrE